MNTDLRYFLWLIPPAKIGQQLMTMIQQLSQRFSSPLFEPHITLLANIEGAEEEIILTAQELAKVILPLKVRLTSLDDRDNFYMSLFIHVEGEEPIMDAHQKAAAIFMRTPDEEFSPHLSLLYGDFPKPIKENIICEIRTM